MPFTTAKSINNKYDEMDKEGFDTIYEILQEILSECDYNVSRSDSASNILRDIIIDLDKAELIVADLTALNPNVMYELGIRHTLCKKTLLITQDINELPFDLKGYYCIEYAWKTNQNRRELSRNIKQTLLKLQNSDDPRYGPFHTYIGIKKNAVDEHENKNLISRLESLAYELGFLGSSVYDFIEKSKAKYKIDLAQDIIPDETHKEIDGIFNYNFTLPACNRLLSEMYIPDKYNNFSDVIKFANTIRVITSYNFTRHILNDENPKELLIQGYYNVIYKAVAYCGKFMFAVKNNITDQKISELKFDKGLNKDHYQ